MGKSPKLFCYGHRPGLQFGIFGGPTLISEGVLPKPHKNTLSGCEATVLIESGLTLDVVFRGQRTMLGCRMLAASENPLPDFGPLLHYRFYQEGSFLVFTYQGKRVWALRSELLIV